MKILGVISVIIGLAFGAGPASAVTYSFTGANPDPTLFSLSCDAGGTLNTGCAVTIGSAGVGVNGFGSGGIPDTDPGNIDSFPGFSYETLLVTFLKPFNLTSIELGNFTNGFDDWEYALNGDSTFIDQSIPAS